MKEVKVLLAAIDEIQDDVVGIAKRIFDNPELAYEEHFALREQVDFLSANGFAVDVGLADLPTSFKATWKQNNTDTTDTEVAFISEYDALPSIGHGCGHHLMAGAAVGAAVGVKRVMEDYGFGGTVSVIGTPAEENGGGKIALLDAGCFHGVTACFMFHPSDISIANPRSLSNLSLVIQYYGNRAHAGESPEKGRSALSALITLFNNIDAIRMHFASDVRVHGVVTHGGVVENIIPDFAEGLFTLRAKNPEGLDRVRQRFDDCAKAAAIASDTRFKIDEKFRYAALMQNRDLVEMVVRSFESLGEVFAEDQEYEGFVSTDAGNVSQQVPLVHPLISVVQGDSRCALHTQEFARLTNTEYAYKKMITVSKALGMTALELIVDENACSRIKRAPIKSDIS